MAVQDIIATQQSAALTALELAVRAGESAIDAVDLLSSQTTVDLPQFDFSPSEVPDANPGEIDTPPDFEESQFVMPSKAAQRPVLELLSSVDTGALSGIVAPGALPSGLFQHDAPNSAVNPPPTAPNVDLSLAIPQEPTYSNLTAPTFAPISDPGLGGYSAPDATAEPAPSVGVKSAPVLSAKSAPTLANRAPLSLTPVTLPDIGLDPGLPTFSASFLGHAPTAPDVATAVRNEFSSMSPVLRQALTTFVDGWISSYAPNLPRTMTTLRDEVARGVAGGLALTDQWEARAYDRARERSQAQADTDRLNVQNQWRAFGWTGPSFAERSAINAAFQAGADRNAMAANEIYIERAKIELQHKQFIMGLANSMEAQLYGLAFQYSGQLLQSVGMAIQFAQAQGEALVSTFNAAVGLFQAYMSLYQTEASVFEARLKASLARLEVVKARLENARLAVEIQNQQIAQRGQEIEQDRNLIALFGEQLKNDGLLVDIFEKTIQADAVLVDLYGKKNQAKMAAVELFKANVQADANKLELAKTQLSQQEVQARVFSSLVEVENNLTRRYAARIDGIRAQAELKSKAVDLFAKQIDGYAASLQGIKAQTDVYTALMSADAKQIDGYVAQWQGYKAQIEGGIAKVGAQLEMNTKKQEFNRVSLDTYATDLKAWGVEVDAEKTRYGGAVEAYMAKLGKYAAAIDRQARFKQLQYAKSEMSLKSAIAQAENELKRNLAQTEVNIKAADMQAKYAGTNAQTYASFAGHVANSINALASESTST